MLTTDNDRLTTNAKPYAALPLGWAALLLYLTLAPADKLPPQPRWELLSFDTFAHAAFFAVQAALAWFSLRRQTRWPALARHSGWVVLLGCTAFGALIEGLQMVLPFNRHGEWSDLISDSLGTAVALGLCYVAAPALRRRGWALGLLGALLVSGAQAQDMPRVRKTIEALASPKMHGRGYVQEGDKIAARYLQRRFKQLKLQTLAPDYTQSFGLTINTFPSEIWANYGIKGACVWYGWQAGRDFIAAPNSGSGQVAGRLHVVDSTIFTSPSLQQWYRRQPFNEQILWLAPNVARRMEELPERVKHHLDSAAAWISLVPKLTASFSAIQSQTPRLELLQTKVPHFTAPSVRFGPTEITPDNGIIDVRVKVDAQLQRNYQTQNLAAIVRGSAQPDSFLIVSAHYDHLGMMGKKVYFPGANDNASGVAMLLELAAYYAKPENRPVYSVVFMLFGAEEAGLVGSQYFVAHPLVPLRNIKFLLNLDLLGSGEQGATVVNGRIHEAAFRRLTAINEAHHYLPALGARGKAANSDHYPFSEAGVPAFYLYLRGASKAYHDVNDTPASLTLAGFPGAFGLVRDFLDELGARPK